MIWLPVRLADGRIVCLSPDSIESVTTNAEGFAILRTKSGDVHVTEIRAGRVKCPTCSDPNDPASEATGRATCDACGGVQRMALEGGPTCIRCAGTGTVSCRTCTGTRQVASQDAATLLAEGLARRFMELVGKIDRRASLRP